MNDIPLSIRSLFNSDSIPQSVFSFEYTGLSGLQIKMYCHFIGVILAG